MVTNDVRAREALRAELYGILALDPNKVPIGRIVSLSDPKYTRVDRLHTTIATKIKPWKGPKCRLCIRGDQQSLINAAFTSSPTASREYLRILAMTYCNEEQFVFEMTEVSRAFTQSGYFHVQDRIVALVPKCVCLCYLLRGVESFISILRV